MSLEIRQQVALAVKAIEGKKGENVVILEMDRSSGAFTDYFILCSGTNPRQIQAIADDVQKQLSDAGQRPNSVEGYNQAEWVLVDYVDFVLHVFSERARQFYDLERLWKSARRLTPADLAKKPAAKKKAKKAAARKKSALPRTAARGKSQLKKLKTKKKSRKSA
jgi:ribosome-associated protein